MASELEEAGLYVWLDEAEIRIGDSLIAKIAEAIDECDVVIAVLSSRSVESSWVQKELSLALTDEIRGRRLKVLPVVIETCHVPIAIRDKLYADLRDQVRYAGELARVVASAWSALSEFKRVDIAAAGRAGSRIGVAESISHPIGPRLEKSVREYAAYRGVEKERFTGQFALIAALTMLIAIYMLPISFPWQLQVAAVLILAVGVLGTSAAFLNDAALDADPNLVVQLEDMRARMRLGWPHWRKQRNIGGHNRRFMLALRCEQIVYLLGAVLVMLIVSMLLDTSWLPGRH